MVIPNLARYRRTLELYYTDICTVRRAQEVELPWGETRFEEVTVYEDVPCRISQRTLGVNGQTETTNEIAYETKLFIASDLDIRQGDVIAVTRGGVTREYTAGEPFLYPTHQEISLQRKEKA